MQRARAAGAGLVLDIDDRLDPGQVRRQGAPISAALGGGSRFALRVLGLGFGGVFSVCLLDIFQAQFELVQRQGLRPAAEAVALHLRQDLGQPIGPRPLG